MNEIPYEVAHTLARTRRERAERPDAWQRRELTLTRQRTRRRRKR